MFVYVCHSTQRRKNSKEVFFTIWHHRVNYITCFVYYHRPCHALTETWWFVSGFVTVLVVLIEPKELNFSFMLLPVSCIWFYVASCSLDFYPYRFLLFVQCFIFVDCNCSSTKKTVWIKLDGWSDSVLSNIHCKQSQRKLWRQWMSGHMLICSAPLLPMQT